jgi:hypothetical protein
MRRHRGMGVVLLLATSLLGCGLVKFDVSQDIPEQTVPGNPLAGLLPPALFAIPLDIDVQSSAKARGAGAATSASIKSLSFTIKTPPSETFAFLDSITIKISAPGRPEVEVASLSPVPHEGTIQMKPTPGINLLPYLEAGPTMTAVASGHAPSQDITFNGKLVITVKI